MQIIQSPDLICSTKEHEDLRLHEEVNKDTEALDVFIFTILFSNYCAEELGNCRI